MLIEIRANEFRPNLTGSIFSDSLCHSTLKIIMFILGVYISRASYIRQGEQSLDSFYSPWHLVEYYRYIRFFPDGLFLIILFKLFYSDSFL
jgi:hypothetical protein